MDDDKKISAQVEIWKKIIDVQQHFNDLELRIRNFALVVTGAFLGLGGYAIKDGEAVKLVGHNIPTASLIVGASTIPLLAFYIMDRLWYHRLLNGAVKAGISAEEELGKLGLVISLGKSISQSSPVPIPFINKKMHSRHKMDWFYGLLAVAVITLTIALTFGTQPSHPTSDETNNFIDQDSMLTESKNIQPK